MIHIKFRIVQGPEEGGTFDFVEAEEVVVGSDFSCDLVLVHPGVMPRHARVVDEKDGVFLEDIAGLQQTKLNGEFVSRAPLHNGDELQIGPYVFHIAMEVDISSYGVVGGEYSERPGRGKRLLHAAKQPPVLALILVLGIVGAYLGIGAVTAERGEKDLSVLGPLELPATGIYGSKVGGKNYVDKVEFTFFGSGARYHVEYSPGFIRWPDLVQIYVNDERIGAVPATIDRWGDQPVSVEIPERAYRMGEVNTIRFDNVRNPPATERWGVRNVSVREVPVPRCDIEAAQRFLHLAQKRYADRGITESNLYHAIQDLRNSQVHLMACDDSELKNMVADTLARYSEELDAYFDDSMFNTRKLLNLRAEESARRELERVLRYIPDETDLRHQRAREILGRLDTAAAAGRRR